MNWILILIVFGLQGTPAVSHIPFKTGIACKRAHVVILRGFAQIKLDAEAKAKNYPKIVAYCVDNRR